MQSALPNSARSTLSAIVDWSVLTVGVLSLGFSVVATLLTGEARVSDAAALQAQPVTEEL